MTPPGNGFHCIICGDELDGTRRKICRKIRCKRRRDVLYVCAYQKKHRQRVDRNPRIVSSVQDIFVQRLISMSALELLRVWRRWRVGRVEFVRPEVGQRG